MLKRSSQAGQGLTEYLILLVLISLVSIAAVRSLGNTIQNKLSLIRNHIDKVSPSARSENRSTERRRPESPGDSESEAE
ncbi:MAG: hypothetical protein RJB38_1903 [Pseudomonadota bacterium]|jgi:Flp pilus assembly pilin Flp